METFEKKYKDALERAKDIMNNECSSETTKAVCQELFPELAESEDERISEDETIRKTLANLIVADINELAKNAGSRAYFQCVKDYLEDVIAYNKAIAEAKEKQKDLAVDGIGLHYYDGEKLTCCLYPAMEENPYDFAMNQQEEKPKDGDNETEIQKAFREGESAGRKEVFDHPEAYGLTKQKPAEWSEEDEEIINSIICNLEYLLFDTPCSEKTKENLAKRIKWLGRLKSLRPQNQGIYKTAIENILEMCESCRLSDMSKNDIMNFWASIKIKCKNAIQSTSTIDENHWKPSEEQISVFLKANPVNLMPEELSVYHSLCNDIQKLM